MKNIWILKKDDTACTHYRCSEPTNQCKGDLLKEDISLICSDKYDISDELEAVIIHGCPNPQWLDLFAQIQSQGVKMVISIDDDLWRIPPHNPAYVWFDHNCIDALKWSMEQADMIIVSTEPLKQVVKEFMKRDAVICPNLINHKLYFTWKDPDQPISILWAGSVHHEADLEEITQPIEAIMKEYGVKVKVYFFGTMPDSLSDWQPIRHTNTAKRIPCSRYYPTLGFVEPVPLNIYPHALCTIHPDIALCPLTNEKFNDSKSANKAHECALAGAALICSDMPPYKCYEGAAIFIQPGDKIGWYEAIKRLIDNTQQRKTDAAAAHITAMKWSWDGEYKSYWLDMFRQLADMTPTLGAGHKSWNDYKLHR